MGFQTEDNREKSLARQSYTILTIVSIYSLAILYVISFNILNLNNCRLILFLVSIYICFLFCLYYAAKSQIDYQQVDTGTISEMDEEYTNVLIEGFPLDELYLSNLNKIHICKRKINDTRGSFIFKAYMLLIASLCLPVLLGTIYIL